MNLTERQLSALWLLRSGNWLTLSRGLWPDLNRAHRQTLGILAVRGYVERRNDDYRLLEKGENVVAKIQAQEDRSDPR